MKGRSGNSPRVAKAGGGTALDRRTLLGSAVTAGSYALIPLRSDTAMAQAVPGILTELERAVLDAFVDRIMPVDDSGPGALAAGAADYIDSALAQWLAPEAAFVREGLSWLDQIARSSGSAGFAGLADQAQDDLMRRFEQGGIAEFEQAQAFFNRLLRLTLEGCFCDPYYGGNRSYIGWDLIGYPGAVMASTEEMQRMGQRLPPLHTSAYGGDFDGH